MTTSKPRKHISSPPLHPTHTHLATSDCRLTATSTHFIHTQGLGSAMNINLAPCPRPCACPTPVPRPVRGVRAAAKQVPGKLPRPLARPLPEPHRAFTKRADAPSCSPMQSAVECGTALVYALVQEPPDPIKVLQRVRSYEYASYQLYSNA